MVFNKKGEREIGKTNNFIGCIGMMTIVKRKGDRKRNEEKRDAKQLNVSANV